MNISEDEDLNILDLPVDAWYLIFEYLDAPSFIALQNTNESLRSITNNIPSNMILSKLSIILIISSKIEEIVTKNRQYFTDQASFLLNSLTELIEVIQNCLETKCYLGEKICADFWKEIHYYKNILLQA